MHTIVFKVFNLRIQNYFDLEKFIDFLGKMPKKLTYFLGFDLLVDTNFEDTDFGVYFGVIRQ